MKGRAKGIDWDAVDDLGKVSDRVIAERLGISISTVMKTRKRRGIPAAPFPQEGTDWASVPDLGITPDEDIALRLGVTRSAVGAARVRRGITAPRVLSGEYGASTRPRKAVPTGRATEVERRLRAGETRESIARAVGASAAYVTGVADMLGIPAGDGPRAGETRRLRVQSSGHRGHRVTVRIPGWWLGEATSISVTWHKDHAAMRPDVDDAVVVTPAPPAHVEGEGEGDDDKTK